MAKDIIDNRVGEPDTDFIPPHLRVGKLPVSLHHLTEYGYSLDRRGIHHCLEAIAVDFNFKNNSNITEANIVLASGARAAASSAILHAMGKHKGRKVLLVEPGYNLYRTQFEGFGFTCESVNIDKLDTQKRLQAIKAKLSDEVLFLPLCNPNNPTGEIYSEEFLRGILELLGQFPHLHIINDSIYDRVVRDNTIHPPNIFALANPTERKRVFEVNALSKFYSYPAIRAGWLISDPEEIAKIQETKDAQLGPLNNVAQLLIIAALEMTTKLIPDYFEQVNSVYNARLRLVHEKLQQIQGFKSAIPAGSFYYWADFSGLNIDAKEIVDELEKQNIYLAWGGKFGNPNCIRINCGAKAMDLAVICDAVAEFCQIKGAGVTKSLIYLSSNSADLPGFSKDIDSKSQ